MQSLEGHIRFQIGKKFDTYCSLSVSFVLNFYF